MLLKSSSTPFLGSLLSSISESPSNHPELHGNTPKHAPSPIHNNCSSAKLSCVNGGTQKVSKSVVASPSPSISENKGTPQPGFLRRVQSEGNLEELTNALFNIDDFSTPNQYAKRCAKKSNFSSLEPIPSSSPHHKLGTAVEGSYDDEEEHEEYSDEELDEEGNNNPFTVENYFVFEQMKQNMNSYGSMQGIKNMNSYGSVEGKMYLASGIGVPGGFVDVSGGGFGGRGGGGSGCRPVDYGRDGGRNRGLDLGEHYRKMLQGSPGNPLFLRNYAQFLHLVRNIAQFTYYTKGDLRGAEEYYSRAILADPADGEVLAQYAKLIWELHHDRDRAANYFKRAVDVSAEDSTVHAAYASFLWDLEEAGEKEAAAAAVVGLPPLFRHGIIASATA